MGNVNACDVQCVKGDAALRFVHFQHEREIQTREKLF